MSDCVFCKIIHGEIPSTILYEDEEFQVILDRFPSSVGHTLILPKKHYETIFELPQEAGAKLFSLAIQIAPALKQAMGFENMNVLQNNGPIAGQSVNHFHLHLIPRYPNDTVKIAWSPSEPSITELESMQKNIMRFLK